MRAIILFAGASLALCSCGKHDQAATSQNVDDTLTAQNIVANDVTAIDAVTGDASNMAADVAFNAEDNSLDNADSNAAEPKPAAKPHRPASKPAENSSGNTAQ